MRLSVALYPSRIIPARAGFTIPAPEEGDAATDHPRSRGVYERKDVFRLLCLGSSPLARGLLLADLAWGRPAGIIPARAGFTRRRAPGRRRRPDHPRSRGVYFAGPAPICS